MAAYTQILYHIVWSTKNLEGVLSLERQGDLQRFIMGKIHDKDCNAMAVGGYLEHIHVLTTVNPDISLHDLVDYLKQTTENWIKENQLFPDFHGWQDGYGAITCSWQKRGPLSHYIENQEYQHHCLTYQEEIEEMLTKSGINYTVACLT
ncbi:MAG: transposase [Sedimentisphaerales bacterium]|nr:transposase [Sedimentisphaerales bacterium]